jgi:hypothetical protein
MRPGSTESNGRPLYSYSFTAGEIVALNLREIVMTGFVPGIHRVLSEQRSLPNAGVPPQRALQRYDALATFPQQIDLSVQSHHEAVDTLPLEYRMELPSGGPPAD